MNSAMNLRDIGRSFLFDIGKLSRETDGLYSVETAPCRPRWIARASSISRSAWRVSRSNSRGSLARAALCREVAAALRSSFASAPSDCGSRSSMAPDRVITASLIDRLQGPPIGSPCGLDVRSLRRYAMPEPLAQARGDAGRYDVVSPQKPASCTNPAGVTRPREIIRLRVSLARNRPAPDNHESNLTDVCAPAGELKASRACPPRCGSLRRPSAPHLLRRLRRLAS